MLRIYSRNYPSTDETHHEKHLSDINTSFGRDAVLKIESYDHTSLSVSADSATLTLFIHSQVCRRAPLGWLWQAPPNVRRWPMLRSQAARPECVWPGWKVPFRPSAASLLLMLLLLLVSSTSERQEEEDGLEGKNLQCGAKAWAVLCKSHAWMYRCMFGTWYGPCVNTVFF